MTILKAITAYVPCLTFFMAILFPSFHLTPVKVNIVKNPLEYKRFGYIAFQTGKTSIHANHATNPSSASHCQIAK
ncbi:hypothetical protein QUF86_06915 [Peribacillus sp. NJ11]|uniref:hypothetical protein n=1 Tax=Peribacillus sp. NJ11 TaxID=3055861 RepID=UPI0025A191E4|nr:hypothetical protein [Peribacillus sp. NJ11]MDM5220484.1 hypothetical protein [Peribacillus sp. NJ11]